jgi:hypothetical protein
MNAKKTVKAPRGRLSQTEKFKVYEFLKANLKVDGEFVDYLDNWTDVKVAAHFDVSRYGVQYIRQEMFGKLRPHEGQRPEPPSTGVVSRLDDLEARLAFLEKELGVTFSR